MPNIKNLQKANTRANNVADQAIKVTTTSDVIDGLYDLFTEQPKELQRPMTQNDQLAHAVISAEELDKLMLKNQVAQLENDLFQLRSELQKLQPKPETAKAPEAKKAPKTWLTRVAEELKLIKDWLGYVIDIAVAFPLFKVVFDIFSQVFTAGNDLYNNFSDMHWDERLYAISGIAMMTAGVSIMITSFAAPGLIVGGAFIGAAVAAPGAYLARQSVKRFSDPDAPKLHQLLGSFIVTLAATLGSIVLAPVYAAKYAYNAAFGAKPQQATATVVPSAPPELEAEQLEQASTLKPQEEVKTGLFSSYDMHKKQGALNAQVMSQMQPVLELEYNDHGMIVGCTV